jgi:hypothetical protein
MSIQPGIGYDIVSTPEGESLVINFPDDLGGGGNEQFRVVLGAIAGTEETPAKTIVRVVRGRVLCRQGTNIPVPFPHQMNEYSVNKFAVYPTDKLTTGTNASSEWASNDGYVEINKFVPAEGETPASGSNTWGVYLVRNQFESETGTPGMPYLAVMAVASDAETKSRPWHPEMDGDAIAWNHVFIYKQITVATFESPYEVTFNGEVAQDDKLQNYNCQRVKVATLLYDAETSTWSVTQHLIGTLTLTTQEVHNGTIRWDNDSEETVPWATWPLYSNKNDDWNGAWTGYTKTFSGATANIGV